jgi:hypothetical protein
VTVVILVSDIKYNKLMARLKNANAKAVDVFLQHIEK